MSGLPGILLAAGASRRFGTGHKLTADLAGRPLVQHALAALLAADVRPLIVVLGHQAAAVRAAAGAPAGATFLEHPDWATGRTSTVQAGLRSLRDLAPGAAGVIVHPADVPFVTPSLVTALRDAFAARPRITFPRVQGDKGHPVIFPASSFPLLERLRGEQTLFDYVRDHPEETTPVDWPDDRCRFDIDTAADLARAHALLGDADA